MDKNKLEIEEIVWSIFDHTIKFNSGFFDLKEIMKFRKNNIKTTKMCWITLNPVIDCTNTLYNPKALIMLILN